jgi:glycosyltransferase involved in cell wall biosynthesis
LHNFVSLHGNVSKEALKKTYQQYHFLLLPSKSEGWPKAVAEAMFFGCLPIATSVSCVPFMLDYGNRGILLSNDFDRNVAQIKNEIDNFETYSQKCKIAQNWSHEFTLEKFDEEIKKLLL